MRDAQQQVASFVATHDLYCPPAYRLLDVAAEVGELAADANASSGYGTAPEEVAVARDEVGDTLFALLAFADAMDIDAQAALEESLEKYQKRLAESGDAASTSS